MNITERNVLAVLNKHGVPIRLDWANKDFLITKDGQQKRMDTILKKLEAKGLVRQYKTEDGPYMKWVITVDGTRELVGRIIAESGQS